MAEHQLRMSWTASCPTPWTDDLRKMLVLVARANSAGTAAPPFAVRELNKAKVVFSTQVITVN